MTATAKQAFIQARKELDESYRLLMEQEKKLEEAMKKAKDLEEYFTQIAVKRAEGEEVESSVDEDQLIKTDHRLRIETNVYAELQKKYQQALKEAEKAEREVDAEAWDKYASDRIALNEKIEEITLALKDKLQELEQLDREQRPYGSRLGVAINSRRFSAQDNFIQWQLREFVETASPIPQGLRRPISEMDKMTRKATKEVSVK